MNNRKSKNTSFEYGESYQEVMLGYYYETKKEGSYSAKRINLANKLLDIAIDSFGSIPKNKINLVDIGCSIGTFAIYFSKKGFNAIGIDFDVNAIKLAKKLNKSEKGSAKFFQKDISQLTNEVKSVDIAICMDIFEHLHDDELGSFLYSIKNSLSKNGSIIFHTLPLEYDYLFWNSKKGIVEFPFFLSPFKYLPKHLFSKIVRIYALIIDIGMVFFLNKVYKQHIKKFSHCNPLTKERLKDIFERAGFDLLVYESGFIHDQFREKNKKYFLKHYITHRSLYGVAKPK